MDNRSVGGYALMRGNLVGYVKMASASVFCATIWAVCFTGIAGRANGDARPELGVSIKECREQWEKLDGLIGRIYGVGWKIGKTPARAAEFANWRDQIGRASCRERV